MKEDEIKEELELCARSFMEARERSKQKSIDDFDELRILESAFNRLFISVEHLCNAIVLAETGNFSKKHFGDMKKIEQSGSKYGSNLRLLYEETYKFRSYADYRKFPKIEEMFRRKTLKKYVKGVENAIVNCIGIMSERMDLGYISRRIK